MKKNIKKDIKNKKKTNYKVNNNISSNKKTSKNLNKSNETKKNNKNTVNKKITNKKNVKKNENSKKIITEKEIKSKETKKKGIDKKENVKKEINKNDINNKIVKQDVKCEKNTNNKFNIILGFIIFLLILLIMSYSYSIFSHNQNSINGNLIAGDLYLRYLGGDTININNMLPSDSYDLENYFEFTIFGKNTNDKDILYEIVLEHGKSLENKIRLDDKFLKFRLTEVINNQEIELFTNKSFNEIHDTVIHTDSVSKETTNEIEKIYRLYVWINGVLVGNTEHCNYTIEEWNSIYTNINISVRSDNSMDTYMINYNPNRLSNEYQEVEYIESFSNEYIKTDIIPTSNMGIYMKLFNKEINSNTSFFGSSNSNNDIIFSLGNTLNNITYGWNQSNQIENSISNNLNVIELNYLNDKKIKVNNNIISTLSELGTNNNYLTIFALNQNNNIINHSSIKLYEFKISIDNVVKYDFIPCYRKVDNVVGLYDIINKKFYRTESGNLEKGENQKRKQLVNYESSVSILDNQFSNQITFYEWNTKPDGSGISYKNNQVVKNLVGKGEVIDLYAIWSNSLIVENIELVKNNNANIDINFTNKLYLDTKVELSSADINSNMLLSVTVKNNSLHKYSFVDFDDIVYDNNDIIYDVYGIKKDDIINSGESITFSINFKYNTKNITNNILNSKLSLVFKNLSGMPLGELVISNNENQIEGADGLYKYDNNYYFSGVNVNNYLWFNCDAKNDISNCEKWRIISVNEDGSVKIIKDSVVEKEVIESLETTTGFWNSNIPTWMISPKILTYGKILFDVKERRPSDKNLVNSYCISTSNGCNAFSSDINNTGLYKNLVVDMDSLAKKYLKEVYYKHGLKELAQKQIQEYVAKIGLTGQNGTLENLINGEKSITTKVIVGLLNISEYIYANKNSSCWNDFSKCTNNSSNNWLTLQDTPYYLLNGKIVESSTQTDKNAQIWTIESKGYVSRDANNEYFLRPVVVLRNNIKALGTGLEGDYYRILS